MAAFHEILFPLDIALKSAGGPERRTEIVALGSGREERNARWAHSRRRYDAGYGVKTFEALSQVVAFFEERRGRLYGFRWRDRLDHSSAAPGARDSADRSGHRHRRRSETVVSARKDLRRAPTRPISGRSQSRCRTACASRSPATEVAKGRLHRAIPRPAQSRFLPGHIPATGAAVTARILCSTCRCASTPIISRSTCRLSPPAPFRKFRWWRSSHEDDSVRSAGQARLRRHHAVPLLDRHPARRRGAGLHRSRRGLALDSVTCRAGTGLSGTRGDAAARPRGRQARRFPARSPMKLSTKPILPPAATTLRRSRLWLVDWSEPTLPCCSRKARSARSGARARPLRAELRGAEPIDWQESGRLYTATCSADLGDARCTIDLTTPAFLGTRRCRAARACQLERSLRRARWFRRRLVQRPASSHSRAAPMTVSRSR